MGFRTWSKQVILVYILDVILLLIVVMLFIKRNDDGEEGRDHAP